MSDPTKIEMLEAIQVFGGEVDPLDIEAAIYWFANDYHGGQWSNLYSVLSTSEFQPSPTATGLKPHSVEAMIYAMLVEQFANGGAA